MMILLGKRPDLKKPKIQRVCLRTEAFVQGPGDSLYFFLIFFFFFVAKNSAKGVRIMHVFFPFHLTVHTTKCFPGKNCSQINPLQPILGILTN